MITLLGCESGAFAEPTALPHCAATTVPGQPTTALDLSGPRTVGQILDAGFRLYARWPLLFILLAGIVVVPYSIVSAVLTNVNHVPAGTTLILLLAEVALVNPFISALQMQALTDLGEGRAPRVSDVLARGVKVLAVVAAADIVAQGIAVVGVFFLLVPGLLAAIRFAVVAPVAACEHVSWPATLRRSIQLTHRNAWRVLGLLVIQAVLTYLARSILAVDSLAGVIIGTVLSTVAQSFCSLLIGLLYFDLRAREAAHVAS
jgi:hypothetical protein